MTDAFSIFAAIDVVVLERVSGRNFRCLGNPPDWCVELWAGCATGNDTLVPDQVFEFLQVFLGEAERGWAAKPARRVDSEPWTHVDEAGHELHLRAKAMRVGEAEILLIERSDASHRTQQLLLQRARELRLAHDAAGRVREQKDILLHCIIHELQIPLRTILSALLQLENEAGSAAVVRSVMSLRSAADRQRELVLDILQVFDHGDADGEQGDSNLREVIDRSVALFEPVARSRGQTLTWDPKPWGTTRVAGNPSRLERVISNLVDNGVRYALGVVSVIVTDEGGFVRVAVEDDGPPVPDDLAPNLFTKLGRWHGTRGDMGLGLYFCRITVEQAGGSVGHERLREGGARFWVRLPRA